MEFLSNYFLFFAKTVTLLIAILFIISAIASSKKKQPNKHSFHIDNYNELLNKTALTLRKETLTKKEFKQHFKNNKKKKQEKNKKNKIYILTFNGDIKASAVDALREEITAILMIAKKSDEVFLKLDSPGGMVNHYGLAASQLSRIRKKGIPLTVAVDKMAASGGYLMACIADKIIAAPFAIIGSIGVIAQIPNFNKALKKHNIEYNEFKAGEFKRTVTFFGENSRKDKQKFQEEIDETHALFKQFVSDNRPKLNISQVATGEHWYGEQAIKYALIDEISTSDDYLLQHSTSHELYSICYESKKIPILVKLLQRTSMLIQKINNNVSFIKQ